MKCQQESEQSKTKSEESKKISGKQNKTKSLGDDA